MFALDILKAYQALDPKGKAVIYTCDSISMRSVKVSSMLFCEIALMEKSIGELVTG